MIHTGGFLKCERCGSEGGSRVFTEDVLDKDGKPVKDEKGNVKTVTKKEFRTLRKHPTMKGKYLCQAC
jgi:hypothetical protein